MKKDVSYSHAKDIFDKLARVEVDGVLLPRHFVRDGCDYWQFYRQRIFEDIKSFTEGCGAPLAKKNPLPVRVKDTTVETVLFFVGLFALGVTRFCKKRVVIYSIDRVNSKFKSDFRIVAIYEFLKEKGIPFTELFHTVIGRRAVVNIFSRKRGAFYLETSDWLYSIGSALRIIRTHHFKLEGNVNLSPFEEVEKEFARYLVARYLSQIEVSYYKIQILTWLFRISGASVLFAIDDARYYYEIIHAAQNAGIKTYALQHGHFTKYHVGWLRDDYQQGKTVAPDELIVWSEYWKRELIRLGTAVPTDAIVVGGLSEHFSEANRSTQEEKNTLTVLIPYETSCPKLEVSAYIREMLNIMGISVIFKLRPDMDPKAQLTEYGLEHVCSTHFSTCTHITDVLAGVDLVVGVYSTFLYDMVARGKRVAVLETSSDYGEGLYINGLADRVFRGSDIRNNLQQIMGMPESVVQSRQEKLIGNAGSLNAEFIRIAKVNNLL